MTFAKWITVFLLITVALESTQSLSGPGSALNQRFLGNEVPPAEVTTPVDPANTPSPVVTSKRRFFRAKLYRPHQIPQQTPVGSTVLSAYRTFEMQENLVKQRHTSGVDKKTPDFPKLTPNILPAGAPKLAEEARHFNRASRLINWIAAISRSRNLNAPLSQFLSSEVAREKNLACPFKSISCPAHVYRRVDGKCNNLLQPLRGSSFTPYGRDVQPQYDSGRVLNILRNDLPRQTARGGSRLPSARLVSNVVHSASSSLIETPVTMLYTNFGQGLAHDITDTPMENGYEGAKLACCNKNVPTDRCASIPIPANDFFSQFGRTCMNFVRSIEVTDVDCKTGTRQQLNMATAYIDGTNIYGHNELEAISLLDDHDGLLKTSMPNHLPFQQHPNFKAFQSGINSFRSGDERVSESTGVIAVVTVWHREHNRIAKILREIPRFALLHEQLRNTVIYEEARKIVTAEMQHVTYNEYLPVTLGPSLMQSYRLKPLLNGYFHGYDSQIDPTISNGFATAYFRFGHSMVRAKFSVLDSNYQPTQTTLQLKKIFWRSNFYLLFENGFQRGVLTDASETCDRHLNTDLRNHMFETKHGNGVDLAALNIQRGRDHGLPSYSEFRKAAFLSEPTEWSTHPSRGLRDMDPVTINQFRSIYRDPQDIDLWSGGVSEIPVAGGQVGPLFAEFMGKQFFRIKFGDRFWYESPTTGFTPDRLNEIRKTSMAKIMCNNVEGIDSIQTKAFIASTNGGTNGRVSCSSLPDIDFTRWH